MDNLCSTFLQLCVLVPLVFPPKRLPYCLYHSVDKACLCMYAGRERSGEGYQADGGGGGGGEEEEGGQQPRETAAAAGECNPLLTNIIQPV